MNFVWWRFDSKGIVEWDLMFCRDFVLAGGIEGGFGLGFGGFSGEWFFLVWIFNRIVGWNMGNVVFILEWV